jgi:phospholipid/cholesterol/gamma-HCH transport system permease protein
MTLYHPLYLLGSTGRVTNILLGNLGQMSAMTVQAMGGMIRKVRGRSSFPTQAVLDEMNESGMRSLPIVALVASLIGMILVLQTAYQLDRFGRKDLVAAGVAVSITREIGPLITAIVVTGRVGAGFAAQLGTMKVYEEILALRTMAIQPVWFLVSPRLLSLAIMLPCLTVLANTISILSGFFMGVVAYDINPWIYYRNTFLYMSTGDIMSGVVKSLIFSGIITMVSCHLAFRVTGGAHGVGKATRLAVVACIVLIIFADMVFTAILIPK